MAGSKFNEAQHKRVGPHDGRFDNMNQHRIPKVGSTSIASTCEADDKLLAMNITGTNNSGLTDEPVITVNADGGSMSFKTVENMGHNSVIGVIHPSVKQPERFHAFTRTSKDEDDLIDTDGLHWEYQQIEDMMTEAESIKPRSSNTNRVDDLLKQLDDAHDSSGYVCLVPPLDSSWLFQSMSPEVQKIGNVPVQVDFQMKELLQHFKENGVTSVKASSPLPSTTILQGQTGSGDTMFAILQGGNFSSQRLAYPTRHTDESKLPKPKHKTHDLASLYARKDMLYHEDSDRTQYAGVPKALCEFNPDLSQSQRWYRNGRHIGVDGVFDVELAKYADNHSSRLTDLRTGETREYGWNGDVLRDAAALY